MTLAQDDIVRALMTERMRISTSIYIIVRDAHVAEDIFQNVTVKALSGKAVFEHPSQLFSWAQITARHEALNWLRDRKKRSATFDPSVLELLTADIASRNSHLHIDQLEALRECMAKLPEGSQNLLEMRYFEERPCTEVSQVMKLGLDTVYQRLSRLHKSLRLCIARQLGEAASPADEEGA